MDESKSCEAQLLNISTFYGTRKSFAVLTAALPRATWLRTNSYGLGSYTEATVRSPMD
jgi:hypothetical protein